MNNFPCSYIRFALLPSNVMRYVILITMKYLSLSLYYNAFMYCRRNIVGEIAFSERFFSCLILRIMVLKSLSCYPLLKAGVEIRTGRHHSSLQYEELVHVVV